MASDNEIYFQRLSEILVQGGFDWVVVQANAEISSGKSRAKEVRALEYGELIDEGSFATRTPRRRRASLMTTEPFNDVERLGILIRGIEAAIASRADIEEAVLNLTDVLTIDFAPEGDELEAFGSAGTDVRHRLDRGRLEGGKKLSDKLLNSLRQLREQARVGS